MRIAKYISDLLFEYECVVIPGLGGFISNDLPANINVNHHSFNPPSRKLVFNPHLQVNDGLLINHITACEKISYTDSRIRLEQFVLKCKYALDKGKRIHFYKIGHLYKNEEDKIEFDPDTSRNYYAGAFGMTSFVSPPVKRDTGIRLDKKPVDRKPMDKKVKAKSDKKKEKEPRYISINLMSILIITVVALSFIFGYSKIKGFYQENAASIPFFYNSPAEYLSTHIHQLSFLWDNDVPETQDIANKETKDYSVLTDKDQAEQTEQGFLSDSEEMEPPTTDENLTKDDAKSFTEDKEILNTKKENIPTEKTPAQANKEVTTEPEQFHYFIIAGSFQDENNAQKLVDHLQSKAYPALIVGQNKYGMYRVSFQGFTSEAKAEEQLVIIRKEENPDAWIFSK